VCTKSRIAIGSGMVEYMRHILVVYLYTYTGNLSSWWHETPQAAGVVGLDCTQAQ